jgi:hypothetical protein
MGAIRWPAALEKDRHGWASVICDLERLAWNKWRMLENA